MGPLSTPPPLVLRVGIHHLACQSGTAPVQGRVCAVQLKCTALNLAPCSGLPLLHLWCIGLWRVGVSICR